MTSKQLEDARREIVRATSRTAKEGPGLVKLCLVYRVWA